MSCDIFQEALHKLPIAEFDGLQTHLNGCAECREIAARLREGTTALSQGLASQVPSLDFDSVWEQAAMATPPQPANRPWWAWAAAVAVILVVVASSWSYRHMEETGALAAAQAEQERVAVRLELVEAEQHQIEARWVELQRERDELSETVALARVRAQISAAAAEQQRASLEVSDGEVDWALWRAAEKEAQAMAELAKRADTAYARATRVVRD
jgi:hypothetical protein